MEYYTEVIEYRLFYKNPIGQERSKVCYTIGQTYIAAKQLELVGAKVLSIQQTNNLIFIE